MSGENYRSAMPDGLDDLYNYDVADEPLPQNQSNAAGAGEDVLGIDEEVQVTKQRKPKAKLDEDRLLSDAGIPKLRKIAKSRMKFKEKGHEFSDVTRLLNIYQLWLDDLYPRAKFADGLAIIEKRGHSKRIQKQRIEWIREDQLEHTNQHPPLDEEASIHEAQHATSTNVATRTVPGNEDTTMDEGPIPVENEIDQAINDESQCTRNTFNDEDAQANGEPPEDELDALFAETIPSYPPKSAASNDLGKPHLEGQVQVPRDEFEDDMEAMADFEDL